MHNTSKNETPAKLNKRAAAPNFKSKSDLRNSFKAASEKKMRDVKNDDLPGLEGYMSNHTGLNADICPSRFDMLKRNNRN